LLTPTRASPQLVVVLQQEMLDQVEHPERRAQHALLMPTEINPVELSRAADRPGDIEALAEWAPRSALSPYRCAARRGFLFNASGAAIKSEALMTVEEGAARTRTLTPGRRSSAAGRPFRMREKIGLDVVLDIE